MPSIIFEAAKMTKEQKREIVKGFTDTAVKVTGLPPQAFMIFIHENDLENVGMNGELISDMREREAK